MDVRDVTAPAQTPELQINSPRATESAQPPVGTPVTETPDVIVSVETPRNDPRSTISTEINRAIAAVNVAATTTNEISDLARSLAGITEQAAADKLPPSRRPVLESEANDLAQEIKKRAQNAASNGIRPLMGDPIRMKLENELGDALEVLLPDHGKEGFGLGQINYSTKEGVLQTQATIERARERIAELQKIINESKAKLSAAFSSSEVAATNQEAAQSSVRDLDRALELAGGARLSIRADPKEAINSLGSLNKSSLRLLEPDA